ncbi:MAG: sugar-binding domain-containing protein, partial [Bacteroidota bacterium]
MRRLAYCLFLLASLTLSGQPAFDPYWDFSLDNGPWETVRVPHDWSVALPFDSLRGEGATGYLLGGRGRYRKTFRSPDRPVTYLYFDGVYNNAIVALNGHELGFHPYGYAPFYYDVSQHLRPIGEENELTVSVDRTRYADSRWYTGSGIYREVKLLNADYLHIPVWGVSVTTPRVNNHQAEVRIDVRLANRGARPQGAGLVVELRSPRGQTVASARTDCSLNAGEERTGTQLLTVQDPLLWDVDTPQLYTVITRLISGGTTRQEVTTPCGIRTFRFDACEGFFLNGKNRKIKGVCLHHDGGAVGAAVPKAVWRRRLQTLKDAGCNAIRSAHNPASEEFLDLCDEMGFLVQDEFYDEWDYPKDKRKNMGESTSTDYLTRGHHEHFQEWAKTDL